MGDYVLGDGIEQQEIPEFAEDDTYITYDKYSVDVMIICRELLETIADYTYADMVIDSRKRLHSLVL